MSAEYDTLRKFVAPEIVFGAGSAKLTSRYVKNFGGNKALVVTDSGVIEAGWADEVTGFLKADDIPYAIFSDLTVNPKAFEVMNGADFYIRNKCDVIIAVGGGSAIDCAKGIGIVASNDQNILEFEGVDKITFPGPPLICIPTTSGSAADISQFAIFTDLGRKVKTAVVSKALVPDVSLIDPRMTVSMPKEVTIASGLDALTHGVESYVSNAHSPLTDLHALKAVELICDNLPKALQNPSDLSPRENMSLASTHAGLAFSNASLGLIHAMAHAIGGMTGAVHGECNGVLLPVVIEFNFSASSNRYKEIAEKMGIRINGLSENDGRKKLVNEIISFLRKISFTKTLIDLDVTSGLLPRLAKNASLDVCLATNPREISLPEIQVIYEKALQSRG